MKTEFRIDHETVERMVKNSSEPVAISKAINILFNGKHPTQVESLYRKRYFPSFTMAPGHVVKLAIGALTVRDAKRIEMLAMVTGANVHKVFEALTIKGGE